MSSMSKKQGQPQDMQGQLSNAIRLPNSRVNWRCEENHWKVLRSCDEGSGFTAYFFCSCCLLITHTTLIIFLLRVRNPPA